MAANSSEVVAASCNSTEDLSWTMRRLAVPTSLRSVAIKLNLCDYRTGDSGTTTSVEFVQFIVSALRRHCPDLDDILLLEHDSSGTRAEHLFALLGFKELAARERCRLFDPAEAEWQLVDSVGGLRVELPRDVLLADLLINAPKLKFHGRTAYTGALKNNFGLLRRKWKVPYHARLCESIVASNLHLSRQLVLVDGLITISGRGPAYGIPFRSNIVMASWDPVAADYAGARWLGIPHAFLSHIHQAERAGIGHANSVVHWRDAKERNADRPHFDWPRFLMANVLRRA